MRVAGVISGTSADAIDVAVCDLEPADEPGVLALRLAGYREEPLPPAVRRDLLALLRQLIAPLDMVAELNFALGEAFAEAVLKTLSRLDLDADDLDLIASHGQTVYHLVEPGRRRATIQLGEPAVIAARTRTTVAADFRVADMAAGGEGAPLAAFLDRLVFGGGGVTRAVQNIGGIANVTFLTPGAEPLAFDTGPGNVLIDHVAALVSGGTQRFDRDGRLAASGTADEAIVEEVLAHPYFSRPPPKTTGRELFGETFAADVLRLAASRGCRREDIVATVTAITAESIARAYRDFGPGRIDEVVLSGGGSFNRTLVREIGRRLPQTRVIRSDDAGLPAAAKEAIAFALLGHETLHGRTTGIERYTGALRPVILGKLVPGDNYHDLMRRVIGPESWPPPILTRVRIVPT